MREREIRRQIEGFLKRQLPGMVVPALGLGLALGGCGGSEYGAPFPHRYDGGRDLSGAVDTAAADKALDLPLVTDTGVPIDVAAADAPLAVDTEKDSAGEARASSEAHPPLDTAGGVDTK